MRATRGHSTPDYHIHSQTTFPILHLPGLITSYTCTALITHTPAPHSHTHKSHFHTPLLCEVLHCPGVQFLSVYSCVCCSRLLTLDCVSRLLIVLCLPLPGLLIGLCLLLPALTSACDPDLLCVLSVVLSAVVLPCLSDHSK